MFPLAIFPEGSLSSSVITTVWVGIWVVCFFNLRLGWVFSGLVIPGYLVPLLLVRPLSAGVIILEALLTYLIVYLFSESSPKIRKWSSLFGRDRFFALVLTSIAVRLISEIWGVPILTLWLRQHVEGISILESDLNGYGLIVTSLIANQIWKPGFSRGLVSFFVTIGITWAIVRFGLMPYTNFSISNLAFMYEDIAASLQAAPKAYIILIVAAFMASKLNLKYGWEFNGILIPSLLALQWYQPVKILSTFIECFFIYGLSCFALTLPIIKNLNMEGARKFLLFFNIGFIYKLTLAHSLIYFVPAFKSSDAFGYGYMLSTLLAVKMHDKKILLKMTRSTLQASLIAVMWASIIGYCISLSVNWFSKEILIEKPKENLIKPVSENDLETWMRSHKLSLQRLRTPDGIPKPSTLQQSYFNELLIFLDNLKSFKSKNWHEKGAKLAHLCHYELKWIEKLQVIALEEMEPKYGWGTYLLKDDQQTSFSLQVPAPLEEWSILDAGLVLFESTKASTLSVAGAGRSINRDGSSDMLTVKDSFFNIFNQHFSRTGILQVRGLGAEYLKAEKGLSKQEDLSQMDHKSELLIQGQLPRNFELETLSNLLPDLRLAWGRTKEAKLQLDIQNTRHGELYISRADRRKMLFRRTARQSIRNSSSPQMISGYLTDQLFNTKRGIAGKGTDLYIPPKLEDLLYFDEEILTPLIEIIHLSSKEKSLDEDLLSMLKSVHASAQPLGYELSIYRHEVSNEQYVILSEMAPLNRYWGTLVLRVGKSNPYHLEVPRPLSEINTLETGTRLFQRHHAEALIISGAHAQANEMGESDPLKRRQSHPFTLFQQVLLREASLDPRLVIQIRALSSKRSDSEAAILASHHGWIDSNQMTPLIKKWQKGLIKDGLPVNLWSGDPLDFGGNPWNTPQARYLTATLNHDFYQLWLPPNLRSLFQRQDTLEFEERVYQSMNITTSNDYLLKRLMESHWKILSPQDLTYQRKAIDQFIESGQVLVLWELQKKYPELMIERIIDLDTKRSFLLGKSKSGSQTLWLSRIDAIDEKILTIPKDKNYEFLLDYLNGVSRWLIMRDVES